MISIHRKGMAGKKETRRNTGIYKQTLKSWRRYYLVVRAPSYGAESCTIKGTTTEKSRFVNQHVVNAYLW